MAGWLTTGPCSEVKSLKRASDLCQEGRVRYHLPSGEKMCFFFWTSSGWINIPLSLRTYNLRQHFGTPSHFFDEKQQFHQSLPHTMLLFGGGGRLDIAVCLSINIHCSGKEPGENYKREYHSLSANLKWFRKIQLHGSVPEIFVEDCSLKLSILLSLSQHDKVQPCPPRLAINYQQLSKLSIIKNIYLL